MNVVWYNKYGCQHDLPAEDLFNMRYVDTQKKDEENIENVIEEIFVPDGSGD